MESMNVKYPVEYLIEHLNSFESPEVAVESLREEGIMCKNRDDLYMFKYHLGCMFDKIYHLACRGVILRKTDSSWKVLSYPFDKFFNWGEELQPEIVNYYQTLRYASPLNEKRKAGFMFNLPMKLIEKLDGTCVVLYYDVVYEGFVAVQEITPRVYYRTKIKHPVYLEHHRIKTTIIPEKLADLFLENKLDDFVLTPDEQETVMKLKEIYTDMRNQLESSFDTIYKEISEQVSPEENPGEFRKRFALRLMDYHDKSWFFARLDGNEEKMQKSEKRLLTERIEKGLFK